MTAIVLAAGMGTRLGSLTHGRPKAMLEVFGRPLLDHQLAAFRRAGVSRIAVVTGFRSDCISALGVVRYDNPKYATTNMVESLMCARAELSGPVLVSYGDILFEDRILRCVLDAPVSIGVAVDVDWRPYWEARFGNMTTDIESLEIGGDGRIVRLGYPQPSHERIDGRYVGLLRFDATGVEIVKEVYDRARQRFAGRPWQTATTFERGYMTDLLQEIIDTGHRVEPIVVERGWLEFDTEDDYRLATEWAMTGRLREFCALAHGRAGHSR